MVVCLATKEVEFGKHTGNYKETISYINFIVMKDQKELVIKWILAQKVNIFCSLFWLIIKYYYVRYRQFIRDSAFIIY